MKLSIKMIKQIIREEIEEMDKEPITLDQIAQKLGVPNKNITKDQKVIDDED
jgi:hypothetical protein